jgi:hypothetical protein
MVAKRDRRRFRDVALPPLSWLVRIRYGLGFAAARESAGECGNSGQGKSDVLRVALIWVLRVDLRVRQKLGASQPSYDKAAAPAVTGITVLGDGIGKAEVLTDVNRP